MRGVLLLHGHLAPLLRGIVLVRQPALGLGERVTGNYSSSSEARPNEVAFATL